MTIAEESHIGNIHVLMCGIYRLLYDLEMLEEILVAAEKAHTRFYLAFDV